jgi:LPS sulfotransferase NodH
MPTHFDRAYLVCATARSGSTLLCELLRTTGRAGRPLEHFEVLAHSSLPRQPREYFDGLADEHLLSLLPPLQPGRPSAEPPEAWWERIAREGTTENGVWGGKIMWAHVPDLLERVHELPGLAGADLDAAVRRLLGDPVTVFVTRRDKVAQAVSLWRAVQTQRWRSSPGAEPTTPVYDFAGIDHLVRQLADDEAAWSSWFERTGRRPLHLAYEEEIEPDPRAAAARVLCELGLPESGIPAPELSRQRDAVSAEWTARYRTERERAA